MPQWGIEVFMVQHHVFLVQEWTQHHGVLHYIGYGRRIGGNGPHVLQGGGAWRLGVFTAP